MITLRLRLHVGWLCAILSCMVAAPALATSPVSHLSIQSEIEYQRFRGAIEDALYVQVDFLLDEKPRVAAVVAGTLAFATNNPNATSDEINVFLAVYNDTLLEYQHRGGDDIDPDLLRGTNLLGAIRRFSRVDGDARLDGFDTRVGDEVLGLLDLEVPQAFSYAGLVSRAAEYEFARINTIGGSPEFTELLVMGFFGADLNGTPRDGLRDIIDFFIRNEGYDPDPPTSDPRYSGTAASIAQLPANCIEYRDLLGDLGPPLDFDPLTADPMSLDFGNQVVEANAAATTLMSSPLYTQIFNCLDAVVDRQPDGTASPGNALAALLDDIAAEEASAPTIMEALDNADDPVFLAARLAELETDRLMIAQDRATIDWSSLLLLQSEQQVANAFATDAREYAVEGQPRG